MASRGYRDRPPGAKRTGRLQNREAAEAAALRANLHKRKAQTRAREALADAAPGQNVSCGHSKDPPNPGGAAIARDVAKP
jgi:hypothetical protein